jgi:hypothetical protein
MRLSGATRAWVAGLAIAAGLGLVDGTLAQADGPTGAPDGDRGDLVRRVDEALARQDLPAAERAWHEAYIAALGAWPWEKPLEVGQASLRISEVSPYRQAWTARARNLYLTALLRAQQQGSLEGALRAAEAFAGLGDRKGVEQSLRIAERLASETGGLDASARVRAVTERLAAGSPVAGNPRP